jgi:hypothetical protein
LDKVNARVLHLRFLCCIERRKPSVEHLDVFHIDSLSALTFVNVLARPEITPRRGFPPFSVEIAVSAPSSDIFAKPGVVAGIRQVAHRFGQRLLATVE